MTGKRFDPPRPDWNILRRLGELAQLRTHESDSRSINGDPDFLPDARSDCSPLQTFFGPADYCIGKTIPAPESPVSVRNSTIRGGILGCDYVIGGARSDEVRQGQTNNSGFSGAARHKSRHTGGGR